MTYFKTPSRSIAASIALLVMSAVAVCVTVVTFRDIFYGSRTVVVNGAAHESSDDHFALLFKSNREEMDNVPIHFSKLLPPWLKGTLVRNGPGLFENGDRSFVHVFDGLAKMASWKFFGNGTALFSTRFLRSKFYKDTMESKSIAPYLIFETVSPPFDLYERLGCFVNGVDNMNVNVYEFTNSKTKKKEYAVLSDNWLMYEISILNLSTTCKIFPKVSVSSTGRVESFHVNILSLAHPLLEFGKNNHLTYLGTAGVLPWEPNRMSLMRITSLKRREVVAQWPVDRLPYMHSFSVTQTRAIFLASPFYIDFMCVVRYAEASACLDWNADTPSTLYVINLQNKKVDRIEIPNVFTMHHVNAYDDLDGNVVMDICSYPNPNIVKQFHLNLMRDPVKRNEFSAYATLKRITINMTNKTAVMVDVDSRPNPSITSMFDVPVINEAYRSRHYCFVYGLTMKLHNVTLAKLAIVKKDVCHDGLGDRVWYVPRQYPVEPWFVARPGALQEDDGILFVQIFRGSEQTSYLVMLDAKDLTVINEAKLPTRIPFSFHGRFFPN